MYVAAILSILTCILFVSDVLRLTSTRFMNFYMKYFGSLLREKEKNRLNGTTFFFSANLLVVLLFHPIIAICASLFLILGDLAAAMVGMSFGRTKFPHSSKSVEGSVAMFLVCFLIGFVCFKDRLILFEYVAAVGATSATLAELIPIFGIDDNFTIPLISGFFMTLAAWRLGEPLVL